MHRQRTFPKLFLLSFLIVSLLLSGFAQDKPAEKPRKTGLWPADWVYTLAEGVTTREITFYSDGIACYGKIFFPKGYAADGKTPGIVLGQGWAGNHFSIEKYGARFAARQPFASAQREIKDCRYLCCLPPRPGTDAGVGISTLGAGPAD